MAADERFPRNLAEQEQVEPEGTFNEPVTGPVADWATDFSHLEPEWAADPYPIQDDLRERCPIAHTGRFGGGWLPVRYEDVAAIMNCAVGTVKSRVNRARLRLAQLLGLDGVEDLGPDRLTRAAIHTSA